MFSYMPLGFIIFKMFQRKIFGSTTEKDEVVFARVSEYVYVEEIQVTINAQCDTTGIKISLCQRYKRYVQRSQFCVF
jgi:hypothetical protein